MKEKLPRRRILKDLAQLGVSSGLGFRMRSEPGTLQRQASLRRIESTSTEPTPLFESAESPTLIDGVLTYGINSQSLTPNPMDNARINAFLADSHNQDVPYPDKRLRLVYTMAQEAYENFASYTDGESPQQFAKRHIDYYNEVMVPKANEMLRQLGHPGEVPPVDMPFMMVTANDADQIPSYHLGWKERNINGVDGTWQFQDDNVPYDPRKSSYCDRQPDGRLFDWAWLHEARHSDSRFCDRYAWNKDLRESTETALQDIPREWKYYGVGQRNDIHGGGDLMLSVRSDSLAPFFALNTVERMQTGRLHDPDDIREAYGLRNLLPRDIVLRFNPRNGQDFSGKNLEIYGSSLASQLKEIIVGGATPQSSNPQISLEEYRRVLEQEKSRLVNIGPDEHTRALASANDGDSLIQDPLFKGTIDTNLSVPIGDVFKRAKYQHWNDWPHQYVPSFASTIWLIVRDPQNQKPLAWGIRDMGSDFISNYLLLKKPFGMELTMNLSSGDETQADFPWEVQAKAMEAPYKLALPQIHR